MIKMIATDIDGTILKYNYEFNQPVIDCIKNLSACNIPVVLVTGRMHGAAKIVADRLDLKTPIISYQGGLIKDGEKIIYERTIDPKTARKIINWGKANNIHLNVYVEDKLYVEDDNQYIKDYIGDKGIDYHLVNSFDELDFTKLNKLLAINYDCKFIDSLIEELRAKYPQLYVVKSFDYFCEIANKEATKGNAIKFLAKKYGIALNEVLAIGDQNNDIEMVKTAGIGVAMGNGTPEIKAAADYITDTVQNDGFIKAINKFVWSK